MHRLFGSLCIEKSMENVKGRYNKRERESREGKKAGISEESQNSGNERHSSIHPSESYFLSVSFPFCRSRVCARMPPGTFFSSLSLGPIISVLCPLSYFPGREIHLLFATLLFFFLSLFYFEINFFPRKKSTIRFETV